MKKITSLTLGFSFLIMSYTGVMLFIVPHGRVAYWADWHLFGLSKGQYGELHTTSMVSFLVFASLHIYYNWKPIVSYMKDKAKKVSFTKKEFLIALGLNVVFVVGTLMPIQPFKGFISFGEDIKSIWTKQYGEPPYGHAEETKLKVFCRKMGIELSHAIAVLEKNSVVFQENQTLKTIARNNKIAPNDIYKLIKANSLKSKAEGIERLGRKTLQDLSDMKRIDLSHSIKLLKEKGITDVGADSKIKNIADELAVMPMDVYELIQN
ncbi:MAG: DUF4405 domain-containing protein [Campylobacterota bacterium]|nr:DUF4405 domain-containing protein [Campylobacterota bacterium]